MYSFLVLINIVHKRFKMQSIRDNSYLCEEIRASDSFGDKFNAKHHWSVRVLSSGIQMQSVSCAVCGNYQSVSSRRLQEEIMHSARSIICEDPFHIDVTQTIGYDEDRALHDFESENEEDEDDELGPPPAQNPVLLRSGFAYYSVSDSDDENQQVINYQYNSNYQRQ